MASVKRETGKIGLAKLPLDRFICQKAGDRVGTITTKPFELQGYELALNVDAKTGWVQIELLDEMGKLIPGFLGKCTGADELRLRPKWTSGNLSSLKGRTVKLRFTLQNAKLYAFDFN